MATTYNDTQIAIVDSSGNISVIYPRTKASLVSLSATSYSNVEDCLAALGTTAFSNSYTDLDNKPSIPSLVGVQNTTGTVKNGSPVTSTSGLTACPIISGIPYYKDTNTTTGTTYAAGSVPANTTFATNGSVKNVYDAVVANIIDVVYPVGSIYISVNSTNPGNIFGGSWVAWGSGRVPVGVNANDTDFDTVEETGGNKTLDLKHQHMYGVALSSYYGSATAETNITLYDTNKWESLSSQYIGGKVNARNSALATGTYNESIGIFGSTAQTSNALTSAKSIVQPYITCYMWKRTS